MPVDFCGVADGDGDADAVISGPDVPLGLPVVTVMVPDREIEEAIVEDETMVDMVVAVFFMTTQS